MQNAWNSISFPSLMVSFVVLIIPCATHTLVNGQIRNTESMFFFKVIANKSVYEKAPNKFQISKYVTESGHSFELYIERSPSLTLPATEIVSITIERQRKYGPQDRVEEVIKDMKRSESGRDADASNSPLGFIYTANIGLTQNGQKLFSELARKNEAEHFDCRIGKNSLAIAQLVPPGVPPGGTSSRFVLSLGSKDEAQIKTIFAPIADRVNWK